MHQNRVRTPRLCVPPASRSVAVAAAIVAALVLGGCANFPLGGPAGENLRGGYAQGDKVALLLPVAGPYAGVAEAVRAGVRSANGADDTGAAPKLVTVDSDDPKQVTEAYLKAVGEGATHVIGPLQKPSVDALAAGQALRVPTLALNEGTFAGRPAANFFQFSLSPETDAAEVANKAHAQRFTRALMLYPADSGGNRRADAFRNQWRKLGGGLVGEAAFATDAASYTPTVTGLLAKGGADFIFLAANAEQARAIYPQIRQGAGPTPVIATSDVYAGDVNPSRDQALAGLYFVDMPWMLGLATEDEPLRRSELKKAPASLSTPLGRRLYVMGIDAYRLAPRLGALAANPAATFPGQTGILSIDGLGRVRRSLKLGRFTETGPVPVRAIRPSRMTSLTPRPRPEPAS